MLLTSHTSPEVSAKLTPLSLTTALSGMENQASHSTFLTTSSLSPHSDLPLSLSLRIAPCFGSHEGSFRTDLIFAFCLMTPRSYKKQISVCLLFLILFPC